MPYSRRNFIRDASLAGLSSLAVPSILAQKKHGAKPLTKYNGVRVFFCGAWIFCSDGADGMYAIARDMPGMPHTFPFGKWTDIHFDTSMPCLPPNPTGAAGQMVTPYALTVTGIKKPKMEDIFSDAHHGQVPFTSFNNPKNADSTYPLKLDLAASGLRVIALPVPTRIRGAGYLAKAKIMDNSGSNILYHTPGSAGSTGEATTHIFDYDYDGATPQGVTLGFTANGTTDSVQSGSLIDYHFHTVPPADCKDHGPAMFHNLMALLTFNGKPLAQSSSDVTKDVLYLSGTAPENFQAGPNLPDGGLPELDYEPDSVACPNAMRKPVKQARLLYNLASCSGSGFGVGGNPNNGG